MQPDTTAPAPDKNTIIDALYTYQAQRSGINFGDYGNRADFMQDYRKIAKHGRHARQLLHSARVDGAITAANLTDNATQARRLSVTIHSSGSVTVDYCAGQYYAIEYRSALISLLVSAFWQSWRGSDPAITRAAIQNRARVYWGKAIAHYFN